MINSNKIPLRSAYHIKNNGSLNRTNAVKRQSLNLNNIPNSVIFNCNNGNLINNTNDLNMLLQKSQLVYVGETHPEKIDHQAQLEVLKAMYNQSGSKMTVAFEMMDQTLQPIVDDYILGRITEKSFLEKTDWKNSWVHDFNLYKPIFDFLKQHHIRALAVNVPHAIVRKVARAGVESLAPEERKYIPKDFQITKNAKYLDYLKDSFETHGMNKMMDFDNYLASMCTWNEGMGSKLVNSMKQNPQNRMLVLAGNGHLLFNAGIPTSVSNRLSVKQTAIYTMHVDKLPRELEKEDQGLSDLVWYIAD